MKGIEKSLADGCKVHAFLSGGGLRVVRIEKDNELKGYGEHPHVDCALSRANKDFLAGGRPYNKVSGGTKSHYLTGSSTPIGLLDHWILQGRTFDVWKENGEIVFQLTGLTQVRWAKEIPEEVLRSGKSATWEHRGYTYHITKSSLPNGKPCTLGRVIKRPEDEKDGADPWVYHVTKTGHGKNFFEAMENAFKAEEKVI